MFWWFFNEWRQSVCFSAFEVLYKEMTETKRIAIAHLEKKLFPVANSVIYLDQKRNESRVTEAA